MSTNTGVKLWAGMLLSLSWATPGAGQALTSQDLLAGYKQNYARFETLRVSWARSHVKTPAWFQAQEEHLANLEKAASRPGLDAGRRAELRQQIETQRVMIRDPANKVKRFVAQDFWSDRQRFQVRKAPRDFQAGKQNGDERFRFPDAPVDKSTLLTVYKDMSALSFPGDGAKGFRLWEARGRHESHLGAVFAEHPTTHGFHFPPSASTTKGGAGIGTPSTPSSRSRPSSSR
jgi:hypothetical protein